MGKSIYLNCTLRNTETAVNAGLSVSAASYEDQATAVISYYLGFFIFHFHITMSLQLGVHHLEPTHLSTEA